MAVSRLAEPPPLAGLPRFTALRGHKSQIAALSRLVARDQPGHAYLFEGPEGVGKDAIARAFVVRLACLSAPPEAGDPCGQCRSCTAAMRGDHPDLGRLARDGVTIKIDQVRALLGRLRYEPVLGRIKSVIVESADLLREEAANALLKTLEEPPPRTVFVLVTHRPQLLLQTIRSRCQALRFAELSPADLTAVLAAEGIDPHAAQVAAALAEGSLTQARSLCDARRMEVVDFVARFTLALGTAPATDGVGFCDALGIRIAAAASEEGEEAVGAKTLARQDLPWVLDVMRAVLRDAVLLGAGLAGAGLPYARLERELQALADRAEPQVILDVIDACERLETRLTINPNPRLALSALLAEAALRLRSRPA